MSDIAVWEQLAVFLSIVSLAAIIWRLWHDELAEIYPCLFRFLIASLCQVLVTMPLTDTAYKIAYVVTNPVIWFLAYCVVTELYRVTLEDYPGISGAGRKAVKWCLVAAVVVAAVSSMPGFRSFTPGSFFGLFVNVERSALLGILVFLVLIQLFLARYRLRLSRNRMLYTLGYALYFGVSIAMDIFASELAHSDLYRPVAVAVVAAAALILISGAFLLNEQGEIRPEMTMEDTTPERLRLQQQLADMNRLLARAARSR